MLIGQAADLLKQALTQVPLSALALHKDLLKSIDKLLTHVSPAETPPGAQQTALRNLVSSQGKNAMTDQVMQALGGPAGGAGMPGAGGGGAQPAAPPPGASAM